MKFLKIMAFALLAAGISSGPANTASLDAGFRAWLESDLWPQAKAKGGFPRHV